MCKISQKSFDFCENAREYYIISEGSLLGVAIHAATSFPVGKVDFLDCGLIYQINRVNNSKVPLSAYQDGGLTEQYVLSQLKQCTN